MSVERYVGLMSGTSLDGIDAALVDLNDQTVNCRATYYQPYPEEIREAALFLRKAGENELHRMAVLGNRLADLYAEAVLKLLDQAGCSPTEVRAIGCHGQTIRHAPREGYSLQIVNGARLAERTRIVAVTDFRSRDIAAGGDGAPLVPAFHAAQFQSPNTYRVILNVGGIANVTALPPAGPVRGFDTGPGNMLLDGWVQRHLGKTYDDSGLWARSGTLLPELLQALDTHPYLLRSPPKSCGREEFGIEWLEQCLCGNELPADVQATLVTFTAHSIADAIETHCNGAEEVYVCGGGAHNRALMDALTGRLANMRVSTTDTLGLPADWVEAVAFAWLARRALLGLPGNLPTATGAHGLRVLGAIYPA